VTQEEFMTQLNLSGRQPNDTQQKPVTKNEDESIKNQTVGALGALAMFAAVIVIGSCSRSSKPVAVEQPLKPEAQVSAPAVTTPVPIATSTPIVAKKKTRRAAILSYVNREYGLAFNFPRNYRLKTQLKTDADSAAQMNFVQPGGITLAAIELPGNSYPGTDFKSGTVNVSVNPGMTSEACSQFAFPEPSSGTQTTKTDQVKIGAIEFHEVEKSDAAMMKQTDAKYYYVIGNGACYEFALGVGTDIDHNVEEITPVDRKEVFGKLEKILATVKFQPAVMPEIQTSPIQTQPVTSSTQTAAPAAAATTPATSSSTPENTSAHSPEKNPEANPEQGAPVPNL
jgi:hypothetical protein